MSQELDALGHVRRPARFFPPPPAKPAPLTGTRKAPLRRRGFSHKEALILAESSWQPYGHDSENLALTPAIGTSGVTSPNHPGQPFNQGIIQFLISHFWFTHFFDGINNIIPGIALYMEFTANQCYVSNTLV